MGGGGRRVKTSAVGLEVSRKRRERVLQAPISSRPVLNKLQKLTERPRPLRNEALSQCCTEQQKISHMEKKTPHFNFKDSTT